MSQPHHFDQTPETINTIHGVMKTADLVKKVGVEISPNVDIHWVEYRVKGDPTDTIVHRSAHGYITKPLTIGSEQGQTG